MDAPSKDIILKWKYLPLFLLGATLKGKNLLLKGANSFFKSSPFFGQEVNFGEQIPVNSSCPLLKNDEKILR